MMKLLTWYVPNCILAIPFNKIELIWTYSTFVIIVQHTLLTPSKSLINQLFPDQLRIVLFHKSQCALRYLDLMSKIQNISSHRSLGTCLTVTANEQNGDWPAPVSRVSVQPVIG